MLVLQVTTTTILFADSVTTLCTTHSGTFSDQSVWPATRTRPEHSSPVESSHSDRRMRFSGRLMVPPGLDYYLHDSVVLLPPALWPRVQRTDSAVPPQTQLHAI